MNLVFIKEYLNEKGSSDPAVFFSCYLHVNLEGRVQRAPAEYAAQSSRIAGSNGAPFNFCDPRTDCLCVCSQCRDYRLCLYFQRGGRTERRISAPRPCPSSLNFCAHVELTR